MLTTCWSLVHACVFVSPTLSHPRESYQRALPRAATDLKAEILFMKLRLSRRSLTSARNYSVSGDTMLWWTRPFRATTNITMGRKHVINVPRASLTPGRVRDVAVSRQSAIGRLPSIGCAAPVPTVANRVVAPSGSEGSYFPEAGRWRLRTPATSSLVPH